LHKLIPTIQSSCPVVAVVTLYTFTKLVTVYNRKNLSKNILPAIHNLVISHKAAMQIKSKNQRTLIIKYISVNYKYYYKVNASLINAKIK
jgi:hypothetical protein